MDTIKEKQATIEWPFLALHGDEDKLCDVEGAIKFHELAKSTDKEIKVWWKQNIDNLPTFSFKY